MAYGGVERGRTEGGCCSGGQLEAVARGGATAVGRNGFRRGVSNATAGISGTGGASAKVNSEGSSGLNGGRDKSRSGGCRGVVFGFGRSESRFPQRVRA